MHDPANIGSSLAVLLGLARVRRDWNIPADRKDVPILDADHEGRIVAEHGIEALWAYYCTAPYPEVSDG